MAENTSTTYKAANAWAHQLNPLRGLTQSSINQMINQIKRGNDVRLQVAFKDLESITPIFGVCINKRLAGILAREWDIVPTEETEEARTQAEEIKKIFLKSDTRNMDGLTEAIRHLGLAAFRGRACVKPFFVDDELIFKRVENWNVLEWNDKLFWNPDASTGVSPRDDIMTELTEEEVAWIKEERPVDIPGIQVYLRQAVGEENWARFVEKEGVPQVILQAPEGTSDTELDVWNARARMIFEGGSGVLPNGSKIDQLTAARGQDPFSAFVEHQQEVIVLLALGEKLTTLGGSTGLGSNLADVQQNEFKQLINYDCKRISNALTRCAVRKCVNKIFPNAEVKCRFAFVEQDDITPKEYLELAKQAQDMGMKIDVQTLKKLTGLQFISSNEAEVWKPMENAE